MKGSRRGQLTLSGLVLGAPQHHGAIRLVQVRRGEPLPGIAMHTFEVPERPSADPDPLVRIAGHGLAFTTNSLPPSTVFGTRLDVCSEEPMTTGHAILSHPRAILSPHSAFFSSSADEELRRGSIDNITAWRDNGRPNYVVVEGREAQP